MPNRRKHSSNPQQPNSWKSSARSPRQISFLFTPAVRYALILPLLLLMLTTAGCGGCNSKPADASKPEQTEEEKEAERKKKLALKKKKEPREIKPLRPLIGQDIITDDAGELVQENKGPGLLVKPGHWTTTIQEMKSNYDDFVGNSSTTIVDARQKKIPLDLTNFTFQSTRPVALAKGRMKQVEGELYIPEQSKGIQIHATLKNRNSGGSEPMGQPLLKKMPSYQYFVLVLSKEVSKYGFLKVTDAIRMSWEEEFEVATQPHYRVVLADATKHLPLPSNPLTWTGLSHFVWDEVDPTRLSPEQQLALVDWIHWGGRLIINGPDSLDTLRNSFLADYLPAENAGPRKYTTEDLSAWSAYWTRRDQGKRPPQIKPINPWSGIRLKPLGDATELVGGAELFYERTIGRGSIVVSAIQLTERDLVNWPGYDGFLNAGLLRRPRRVFSEGFYDDVRITWADHDERRLDAHYATGLRLFARDANTKANQWSVVDESMPDFFGQTDTTSTTHIDRPGGLGTWSEFNPVANAARTVLTEAAAVQVPDASFVLVCVAAYLVVLVPLNWMVFRALNRLEWAWIAAPIIALLGTLVIVRQAQLDIGFVRSQSEVALLELHNGHPRGLLSRYTALYSSLSTTYDVTFDAPTTVATPFPASESKAHSVDDTIWDVVFEKQNTTRLSGLAVSSASTKMVHSEEVFSLSGPLRLGRSSRGYDQLENRLGYNLRDVAIVRRYFDDNDGPALYQSCWIGKLRDNDSAVISLQTLLLDEDESPHRDQRQATNQENAVSHIDTEALIKVAFRFPQAEDPREQRRDEWRVVGVVDQVLPGTAVSPAASQITGATVLLAHLKYGKLAIPSADVNSRSDVNKIKKTTDLSSNN